LYNKPQGCSTSVALATGPNDEEEFGRILVQEKHRAILATLSGCAKRKYALKVG